MVLVKTTWCRSDLLRQFSCAVVESSWFSVFIACVTLINTLCIGLQTSEQITAISGWYLSLVDQLFLAVYITELILHLYVWRTHFFKSYWNCFDVALVGSGLVDLFSPFVLQNRSVSVTLLRVFKAFRAIRALRALRIIRFLNNLRLIMRTLLQSIPALGGIVLLIALVLYIFAVIGRGLYGEIDPERFGNLPLACYTLFQLITLDDWFFIYTDTSNTSPEYQHILAYLLLFIVCETLIFVNLFVAVIVDNLTRARTTRAHSPQLTHTASEDYTTQRSTAGGSQAVFDCSTQPRDMLSDYVLILNSLQHQLALTHTQYTTFNQLVDLADLSKN